MTLKEWQTKANDIDNSILYFSCCVNAMQKNRSFYKAYQTPCDWDKAKNHCENGYRTYLTLHYNITDIIVQNNIIFDYFCTIMTISTYNVGKLYNIASKQDFKKFKDYVTTLYPKKDKTLFNEICSRGGFSFLNYIDTEDK